MYLQITYDTSQFYFESQKIHDHIVGLPQVLDFWHYLPNVYIVETSTSNEADIANSLIKEFEGLRFLVTKIDVDSPNGVLPQKAWDWMTAKSKKSRGYIKIKTQQPNVLKFSNGNPVFSNQKPLTMADLFSRNQKRDMPMTIEEMLGNRKKQS